jgi:arginyl-tRNA synthetase
MKEEVVNIVYKAIEGLRVGWGLETIPPIDVEIPRNEAMGHVATTVAMRLTKVIRKAPQKIAADIVAQIEMDRSRDPERYPFEEVSFANPGFINFTYKQEYFHRKLQALLDEGHSFFRADIGREKKVQVEFVSANPTGPLHIGHGRGAAIGNALCNLLETAGYEVEREFYINDAGLQVKLLGRSVYATYQQKFGNPVPFPEDGYKGEYIKTIVEEIAEKARDQYIRTPFDECGDFFTGFSYKRMLADISMDLKDFGIEFDRWQSEKGLYEEGKVTDAMNFLRENGFLYEKDGARWFRATSFGDDKDRVVVKKDGEYTYFASDVAYHKDKLDRGFDILINIWGADHHGYIPRLRSVMKAFGLPEERFRIILVQIVSLLRHGRPVQMSKRAGEFVTLREVIDEVGADITKFIFLTRRSDSHLDFDIDVAKRDSSENPVFYVQYAFARISSIFRQAEKTGQRAEGTEYEGTDKNQITDFAVLREDDEISLIRKLLHYQMVFEGAVLSFEPHRITYYLQELAAQFHSFYNRHRVISDDEALTSARLSLCRAVHIVLEEGLRILGVNAPERM